MGINNSVIEDCTLTGGNADYDTVDGFEFWGPCENVVVRRCTAIGFNNGTGDNDGHGFEVYGTSPSEICDNILFVDCHAEGCRIGFTSEGGAGEDALHTNIICQNCTGTDNVVADFGGLQGATIYLQDSTGTQTGNVVTL